MLQTEYPNVGEGTPGDVPHPELRTARLFPWHFRSDDVDDVFEFARNPDWAEYLLNHLPHPYTRYGLGSVFGVVALGMTCFANLSTFSA